MSAWKCCACGNAVHNTHYCPECGHFVCLSCREIYDNQTVGQHVNSQQVDGQQVAGQQVAGKQVAGQHINGQQAEKQRSNGNQPENPPKLQQSESQLAEISQPIDTANRPSERARTPEGYHPRPRES